MKSEGEKGAGAGRKARLRASIALVVFVGFAGLLFLIGRDSAYLWLKALHVIAVISWMAGLLYMPRLFIYHTDAEKGSVQAETFSVMEQRLMKVIMHPAMGLSWLLGLYLAWDAYGFMGGWLHAKIAAVVGLTAVHFYFSRAVKAFQRGDYVRTARFWRLMNEVPTVLMIAIVIFVIVKPF